MLDIVAYVVFFLALLFLLSAIIFFLFPVVETFCLPGASITVSRQRTKAVDRFIDVSTICLGMISLLLFVAPFDWGWIGWVVDGTSLIVTAAWARLSYFQVEGAQRAVMYLFGNPHRDRGRGLCRKIPLLEVKRLDDAAQIKSSEEIRQGILTKNPNIKPEELERQVADALTTKLLRTRSLLDDDTAGDSAQEKEVSGTIASYQFEFWARKVFSIPYVLLSKKDQGKPVSALKDLTEAAVEKIFRGVPYLYIMEAIESAMLWLADSDVVVEKMNEYWELKLTPTQASCKFMRNHHLPDMTLQKLFDDRDDDKAVDRVFELYPKSVLAAMISSTGFAAVYFNIEDRNEDPAIEKEKNAREVARLSKQTAVLKAEAAGSVGREALEIVRQSIGPRPHQNLGKGVLPTPAQQAEIDEYDLLVAEAVPEARSALLLTKMYGATASTVFTEKGSGIKPVVAVPAGAGKTPVTPSDPSPAN